MIPPLLYLLIISDRYAVHTKVLFSLCHKEFVMLKLSLYVQCRHVWTKHIVALILDCGTKWG